MIGGQIMKIIKVRYVKLNNKRKIELECLTDNDTGVSDVFVLSCHGKDFQFVVTEVSEGKFTSLSICTLTETGPIKNRLSQTVEQGDTTTLRKLIGMSLKRIHKETRSLK